MKMKNTFAIAAAIMAATVISGYSVCAEDSISSENVTGDIIASAESEAENIAPGKTAVSKDYSCTSDAVRIHWEQCEGADGYDVYKYSSSAKKWERISTVSDTLNFRDDGLISGTTYMYRIRAFVQTDGAAVMGEFSDIITTATRPAKVEEKKAYTRTDNKIRINWNKVSGATGYEIYRKSSVNAAYKKMATVGSSETEYLDRELKANQTYYYRVKAVKTVGGKTIAGESSDTIRTRTLFTQVKMKSGFSCTTNAVRINWNKVSGADGYQVFRWNGSAWKKVAVIRNGSTTTYRNNGLKAGTTYKYKVKAYKKTGTTYYTGYAGTTKTAVTRPAQTVMQTPNKTSDAVRVKWNKVSGASGYEIYQLKSGTWKKIKTVGASVTNYRIDGLKADTAYHFRVKAYKSIGGKKFTGKSSQVDVRTNKPVMYVTYSPEYWNGATKYQVYDVNGKLLSWKIPAGAKVICLGKQVKYYTESNGSGGSATVRYKIKYGTKICYINQEYVSSAKTYPPEKPKVYPTGKVVTKDNIDELVESCQEYSSQKSTYDKEHYKEYVDYGIKFNTYSEFCEYRIKGRTPENSGWTTALSDSIYPNQNYYEAEDLIKEWIDANYLCLGDLHFVVYARWCPNGEGNTNIYQTKDCWEIYMLY